MADPHAQRQNPEEQVPAQVPFADVPGSAQDIKALVDTHQNGLIRYAYRLLRSRELAQDVVQDAFLRYLRKPLDYGEPRQRVAWLYKVTHNLCIDLVKRESRRGEIYNRLELPTVAKLPVMEIFASERWERLERLLEGLSDNQRSVVLLFFEEGLSYKEISEVTGLSMSNVGMLLHRALKKLRSLIEEENITEF